MLLNIIDRKTDFAIRETDYTGYGVLAKKNCGNKSHVTFSWSAAGMDGSDDGTAKKDKVYIMFSGLDSVEFGNKDIDECIEQASYGVMPATEDYELGCVA